MVRTSTQSKQHSIYGIEKEKEQGQGQGQRQRQSSKQEDVVWLDAARLRKQALSMKRQAQPRQVRSDYRFSPVFISIGSGWTRLPRINEAFWVGRCAGTSDKTNMSNATHTLSTHAYYGIRTFHSTDAIEVSNNLPLGLAVCLRNAAFTTVRSVQIASVLNRWFDKVDGIALISWSRSLRHPQACHQGHRFKLAYPGLTTADCQEQCG